MEFTVSQTTISEHLAQIKTILPPKPSYPILSNVLMKAKDQQLILTTFDSSLGLTTSFPVSIEEEGSICVNGKLLVGLINKLNATELTFKLETTEDFEEDENPLILIVQAENSIYRLQGIESNQYPELPILETLLSVTLPSHSLLSALIPVLRSYATDETKQILRGVHFLFSSSKLELISTDGHRLSMSKLSLDDLAGIDEIESEGITIPGDTCQQLVKLLRGFKEDVEQPSQSPQEDECGTRSAPQSESVQGEDEPSPTIDNNFSEPVCSTVKISWDNKQVQFELGAHQMMISRLLQGTYPNAHQLLPSEYPNSINFQVLEMKRAINRLNILNPKKNVLVLECSAQRQQIKLYWLSSDHHQGIENIPAVVERDLTIAFNSKYFHDAVLALPGNELKFEAIDPDQASRLVSLEPDCSAFVLLMPVKVDQFPQVPTVNKEPSLPPNQTKDKELAKVN
ncbi:DNA polymerase III subunit beta [Gloeothece verrucosa]|uniref:DNA polymerase III, beta subunit n=1 Tax=Gloeothece verrucosa (strain PCC 7822) TaxID=497965 RepID=E0UMD0_GLOV7|nr:DNA polymerase III subunit beta [Gloeothece verrucosa]ADN18110.1 DNA polymerase III, beta subunit [Gloeothece verrucosa PCC 7822]